MGVAGCLACDLVDGRRALHAAEAAELGPLLRRAAAVVAQLVDPEQAYVCLWSHDGGQPVHIHFVVQPATRDVMDEHGSHGPALQVAMFHRAQEVPPTEVDAFCERARVAFAEAS